MAKTEIHENDIGTVVEMTMKDGSTVVDISAANVKQIIFQKPDGSLLTKTASFTTDGTDGKIRVTSVDGDFVPAGLWRKQGYISFPTGESWKANVEEFQVHENLEATAVATTEDNYNSWQISMNATGTVDIGNTGTVFVGTGSVTFNFPLAAAYPGRLIMVYTASVGMTLHPAGTDQINMGGAGLDFNETWNTWKSYISDGVDNWMEWNQR